MRDIRVQYFLTLGMLGTVLPYVSVFFRAAGLNNRDVGNAYAIYGLASVISPALVTMLADRKIDPRRLLSALNLFAAASLGALSMSSGRTTLFATWTLYCLTSVPIFPLLNGIHFGQQQRARDNGAQAVPYHGVRAWGTVGYISISLLLFPMLHWGMTLRWVLVSGGIIAGMAAGQALLLGDPRGRPHAVVGPREKTAAHLPAWRAAKALFSPRLSAFTAAVILISMVSQIHAAYYPIYLTERIKLPQEWLGQASNVAVLVETFLIFGCGWLVLRLGLKPLLTLCILATALRMGLLASTRNAGVAIGTQVFHGLMVLAIGILPQTLINDHAGESFRHSMQGMLVMLTSAGQCAASFLAGFVADRSLSAIYGCAAGLCVAAAAFVLYGFHETLLEGGACRAEILEFPPAGDVVAATCD